MCKKNICLISCCILLNGCALFNRQEVKRDFPEPIKAECYNALNYTEYIIKNVGVHSIRPRSVKVELIPGTRRVDSKRWAWQYKDEYYPNGIWVMGLCLNRGHTVQIAVDPKNIYKVPIGTLQHELAHHWLVTNGHTSMHHYPEYDKFFELWDYARKVTGKNTNSYDIFHTSYHTTNDFISISGVLFNNE
jgi:hypothetical protein